MSPGPLYIRDLLLLGLVTEIVLVREESMECYGVEVVVMWNPFFELTIVGKVGPCKEDEGHLSRKESYCNEVSTCSSCGCFLKTSHGFLRFVLSNLLTPDGIEHAVSYWI